MKSEGPGKDSSRPFREFDERSVTFLVATKTVDASCDLFFVPNPIEADRPGVIWFEFPLVVFPQFISPLSEVHTFVAKEVIGVRGAPDELVEIFPGR